MFQWLGLQVFIGRNPGSSPGQGAKIPQAKKKGGEKERTPPHPPTPAQERGTEVRTGRKRRGIQGRKKQPRAPILGQVLCPRVPQSLSLFLPRGRCHYPRFIDEATQTQRSCPARSRESWVPACLAPESSRFLTPPCLTPGNDRRKEKGRAQMGKSSGQAPSVSPVTGSCWQSTRSWRRCEVEERTCTW